MRRPLRVRDMSMYVVHTRCCCRCCRCCAVYCMRAVGGGTVLQCIFGSRTAPCVL